MPLLVAEPTTHEVQDLLAADPVMLTWWGSEIECVSALARLEREGAMRSDALQAALARLDALATSWHEIQPGDQIRRLARRLLRVHPLRAGDALQLAAAIVGAEGLPASLELVSFDDRLAGSARREGFPVTGC